MGVMEDFISSVNFFGFGAEFLAIVFALVIAIEIVTGKQNLSI